MRTIRLCRDDERATILAIINAAAEAYRGVIPADCLHEPYMSPRELIDEIACGVIFWGCEAGGVLVGVMGIQPVRGVDLIRHAYVLPESQWGGVGSALLEHLRRQSTRRMLVGTWAGAEWAIAFYRRHGFELVSPRQKTELLRAYWTIPDRQIETSVVLANPPFDDVEGSAHRGESWEPATVSAVRGAAPQRWVPTPAPRAARPRAGRHQTQRTGSRSAG